MPPILLLAVGVVVGPGRYVVAVRVEAARALLEQTELTLEVVAERSGLGSAETLRRTFVRELGVPPQSYRRRFATVGLAA